MSLVKAEINSRMQSSEQLYSQQPTPRIHKMYLVSLEMQHGAIHNLNCKKAKSTFFTVNLEVSCLLAPLLNLTLWSHPDNAILHQNSPP